MPIARYEIRNEYSLADPELYRAADKDDPEALLEGVAMAGLVGLLRQLGDLAEFASEIFHDLHEEVMATAARGHSLTIRVQQLEAEVPSIERAFLSQTDHSPFFYNSGVDWHPNLRMDQNLITQGDLPRFVMDSYEECRGPPRLFLLDKFDIAGAGACLKRYTDPSFFKVETSATSEKKIRKPKKKGPRWRIGEAAEGLPMSHAKFHQLFLDEPAENGVNKPTRRGKLRRRLNGFPFDPKTGKSYMEKLWRSPSPEHKMLHEITTRSSLQLRSNDHDDSDHEVLEVRSVSPPREVVGRKRSPPPQDREEIMLKPLTYRAKESDEVTDEKDITLDGESKAEGSSASCQSDEVASEIDNYVDAPSTMESEMDTDSELRMKNDFASYNQRPQLISLENEEHLSLSSDSQSTGDLKLSDEGNNSSKKESSSFSSSDSQNTSPEKPQAEETSVDIPGIANIEASSYLKGADETFPVNQLPKPVVSDNTCTDKYIHTYKRNDSEQMTSTFARTTPNLVHYGSKRVRKSRLWGPNSDEKVSISDHEEKRINLVVDSQCSSGVSDSKSRSGDDSPRCSSREHPLNESNGANEPCMSADSDNVCYGPDSSAATSTQLLHENGYDWKDLNQSESTSSTLNMVPNVLSPDRVNTAEMISASNVITDKLDGEVLKLPESVPADVSDYGDASHNVEIMTQMVPDGEQLNEELKIEESNVVSDVSESSDTAHNGDIITPIVSSGEQLNDGLEIEDSSVVSDASPDKELIQTSLHNAETLNAEELFRSGSIDHQISSETLSLLPKEGSPDWLEESVDAHDIEVIPEEDAAVDETLELLSPKSCEVVGLQGREITDDVTPNDFVALENLSHTPENLADQAGDGISPYTEETGLEVTESSSSSDLKTMDEVHVQLDESDFQRDKPEAEAMASSLLAGPDDAMGESINLPVDLGEFVEEHTLDAVDNDESSLIASHVDSDLVEEENGYLTEHHEQSGLVEEVDEREAITSDLYTDSCGTISNGIPQLEVSHTVPNSHLDTKVVDTTQTQSSLEESRLDTDQEPVQLNIVESQVSDETSLTTIHDSEEKMLQEKIELPPEETGQDWLSLLPVDDQKMLDHEDHKEDNNSPLSFSLVNYTPSDSKLPGVKHYDNGVSEYPRDTLSFIISPSNPFSENQMNLDELPPLPPLPPVQWRMGKLQQGSSTTEEETMMLNEIFAQQISLPTATTEDVSSSLEEMTAYKEEKVEHKTTDTTQEIENKHPELFIPASNIEAATSAEEDGVASESQTKKLPTYKEEKVEHKTTDTTPELENKHPQLFMPASTTTSAEEDGVASESTAAKLPTYKEEKVEHKTIDIPPEIQNKHSQLFVPATKSDVTISAEEDGVTSDSQTKKLPTYKEEKVENKTIDTKPEIESKHPQLFMPASKSENSTSAEEDGVASETQTKKLPRPRNPLVEDVSVLDKSKLRKVTERVMPQVQKVDERDSILEQIRAKSFNLKPAATSRPTIRGPKTNLQVAAILEKANAIRQAFAGSDDDEEDNWSDS